MSITTTTAATEEPNAHLPVWRPEEQLAREPDLRELVPLEDEPGFPEEISLEEDLTAQRGPLSLRPLVEAIEQMLASPPDPGAFAAPAARPDDRNRERELAAWTEHAHLVGTSAAYLRGQDRLIFSTLGKIVCAVEDYELHRYLNMTLSEFWEEYGDWPETTRETAAKLYRRVLPVAQRVGLPLDEIAPKLSSTKVTELVGIAQRAETKSKLATPEGREEVLGQMLETVHGRTADVLRERRKREDRPEPAQVYLDVDPAWDGDRPYLRYHGRLGLDEVRTADEAGVTVYYRLGGEVKNLRQIREYLDGMARARTVNAAPRDPRRRPAAAPATAFDDEL